jgi:hypothetical protein
LFGEARVSPRQLLPFGTRLRVAGLLGARLEVGGELSVFVGIGRHANSLREIYSLSNALPQKPAIPSPSSRIPMRRRGVEPCCWPETIYSAEADAAGVNLASLTMW